LPLTACDMHKLYNYPIVILVATISAQMITGYNVIV